MTELQEGRISAYLNKHLPRKVYNGRTVIEHMTITEGWLEAVETDSSHLWNRRKYNRMDYQEQRAYEKRMEKIKTEYRMGSSKDGTAYYVIQKMLYDYLCKTFPERVKGK